MIRRDGGRPPHSRPSCHACREPAARAASCPRPQPSSSPPPSSPLLFSQLDGREANSFFHTAIEETAVPWPSQEVVVGETPIISSGNSSSHRSPPVRPTHPPPPSPSPLAYFVGLDSESPDISDGATSQPFNLILRRLIHRLILLPSLHISFLFHYVTVPFSNVPVPLSMTVFGHSLTLLSSVLQLLFSPLLRGLWKD